MFVTDENIFHARNVTVQKFNPWALERFVKRKFENCSWRVPSVVCKASSYTAAINHVELSLFKIEKKTQKK